MRAQAAAPALAALAFSLLLCALKADAAPPEPQGYRMSEYRAPTPATLAGGMALDTPAAQQLWKAGGAVWIDVLGAPRRPAKLPASSVWLPVPHRDIPGSLWLPDVGRGVLNPQLASYFRSNLDHAAKGRRDARLVFYCRADCWMSWNAAKRAVGWGYTRVYWYRDGTDGWEAAKLPLATVAPAAGGE